MYIAIMARDYDAERNLAYILNQIDAEWNVDGGCFYIDLVRQVEQRMKHIIVKVYGYEDMTTYTLKLSKADYNYFGVYDNAGKKRGYSYHE